MSKKRIVEAAKLASDQRGDAPHSVEEKRAIEERVVHTEEMHVSLGDQLEAAHPLEAAAMEDLKESLPDTGVDLRALNEIEVAEAGHVEPAELRATTSPPSSRARERHLHEKRQPHVEGAQRAAPAQKKKAGRLRRARATSILAVREIQQGLRKAAHELYLGMRRAAETLVA